MCNEYSSTVQIAVKHKYSKYIINIIRIYLISIIVKEVHTINFSVATKFLLIKKINASIEVSDTFFVTFCHLPKAYITLFFIANNTKSDIPLRVSAISPTMM
jgi:hypothetical protein